MDEKRLLVEHVEPAMPAASQRRGRSCSCSSGALRRRLRLRIVHLVALVLVGLTAFAFFHPGRLVSMAREGSGAVKAEVPIQAEGEEQAPAGASTRRVPMEVHMMSKCPDALDCMRDLVLPALPQVVDKVDFRLSYIGQPTRDGGVACMHGPAECMGNIIELCAQKLYPDPKIFVGFTMCLMRDYERIPDRDLVEDCALEHAVDVAKLDECATRDDGQYAMNMLLDSVRHTTEVGVTKSCTLRLDDKVYCIRDGGEWTDCPSGPGVHDLIVTVEKLYRQG